MPQGWRFTHPGDPPPRWGLSKTGRLVIAVTVAVGVVIALMIIVARPAGASDDASGGEVEMPEYGFAFTVPEWWLALDSAEDLDERPSVAAL